MGATSESLELPTPAEMVAHLDRHVRGQARAKRDLAVAAYAHYAGKALRRDPEAQAAGLDGPGRQHVLLIGPTGVGKTLLVRTLARLLRVPVVFASATSLVETGYVGEPVEGLLRSLVAAAGNDRARAERGMVFVDEIDKIRRAPELARDVSGEGVQNGLLTLLDGRAVPLRRDGPGPAIDSGEVLFVGAGAFVGLERIVAARRSPRGRLGFAAARGEEREPALGEALATEDLVRFGLIPELVGRFATVTTLEPLGREDLVAVLSQASGSALERQRALYRLHGIDLVLERDALEALSEAALRSGLGARGLARGVLASLRATTACLPELAEDGVERVVVDAGCVRAGRPPRLERGERAGARERVRRLRSVALGGSLSPAERLRELEAGPLRLSHAPPEVRSWWRALPARARLGPSGLLGLAEELARRGARVVELHHAWQRSRTRDLAANLHYLEYVRRVRRTGGPVEDGPAAGAGQGCLF